MRSRPKLLTVASVALRTAILSLLMLLLLPAPARADKDEVIRENMPMFARLDSLIANHAATIAAKEARIKRLRDNFINAVSPSRKLAEANALYLEYHVYDPDSAIKYARLETEIARELTPYDPDRIASALLDNVFILATQGFSQHAIQMIESINAAELSVPVRIKFYGTAQYVYSSLALFNAAYHDKSDPVILKANAYRDSLIQLDPDHLPEVMWAPIAVQLDSDEYTPPTREVEMLKKAVDAATEPSRENAINAYYLARHYYMLGDQSNYVKYLTLAAIYDAAIENREIAAISDLAAWLFDNGDLDRAYTYLIYSNDQANAYHNRARIIDVGAMLPVVRDAYRQELLNRDRRLQISIGVMFVLFIVLAGSIVFIVIENRRLTRARHALAETNSRLADTVAARDNAIEELNHANSALSESNDALSESNRALAEVNAVKQGLMVLSFRLNSDYINALNDFRNKLLRKFRLKDYAKIGEMLSDPDLQREQYKTFYDAFDHMVLSIFPDFVETYNATAPEEARVDVETVKKTRTLNTRLRIHALRRLGVEKSADIAKMLNIAIRTVYNNRG